MPWGLCNILNKVYFYDMRYLAFLSLFCLLMPALASAQSRADYDYVMNKFVKYYNASQPENINTMWPVKMRKQNANLFDTKQLEELQDKYGKINSIKFMGIDSTDPARPAVFKTVFSRAGVKATSITIQPGNFLGSVNLIATSTEIRKMLSKEGT